MLADGVEQLPGLSVVDDAAPVNLPGAPFLLSALLLACAVPIFLRLRPAN